MVKETQKLDPKLFGGLETFTELLDYVIDYPSEATQDIVDLTIQLAKLKNKVAELAELARSGI